MKWFMGSFVVKIVEWFQCRDLLISRASVPLNLSAEMTLFAAELPLLHDQVCF